jgi:hypothetical protein
VVAEGDRVGLLVCSAGLTPRAQMKHSLMKTPPVRRFAAATLPEDEEG